MINWLLVYFGFREGETRFPLLTVISVLIAIYFAIALAFPPVPKIPAPDLNVILTPDRLDYVDVWLRDYFNCHVVPHWL